MSNKSNNNNNKNDYIEPEETSIYVTIPNPDQRKRFTIIYEKNEFEKERCVLMIPKTLSYSGLLGLIISKFKLDSSNRSQIRVKTLEGNRIKTLNKTYNNQILNVTISTIIDEDPEDEITNKALTKSQEYAQEIEEKKEILKKEQFNYLPLFSDSGEINNNLFYNQIIDKLLLLSTKYKYKLIIGESYPYRCKVLIFDPKKESKIWLYFIEKLQPQQPSNTLNKLDYEFKFILQQNKSINHVDKNKIIELLNKQIEIDNQNVEKIIELVEEFYQENFKFDGKETNIGMYDQSLQLFQGFGQPKTVSQNYLLEDTYSIIKTVSEYYDIPTSLARKLLFQNQWDHKKVIGNVKEKNENILNVKSFSFPHKTSDIKLFKFKTVEQSSSSLSAEQKEEECSICYCEYTSNEMIHLLCGHKFCGNCLNCYFKSSIHDANSGSNPISCPWNGCLNKCIDEVTIETLLFEDSKNSTAMVENALQIFIGDILYTRPNSFICPEDNCGRLLLDCNGFLRKIPYVNCNGNHLFCLLCKGKHMHWPSPCDKQLLSDSDLFSFKWIIQNTTICSRCKYPIERNQGCSHMTCSRCRHQFCWFCGSDYNHTECDRSERNKINQFLNVFSNKGNIDPSFLEDFILLGTFRGNDPVSIHIYQSFLSILTNRVMTNKRQVQIIQKLLENLHFLSGSNLGSLEYESKLFSCRAYLKKLLSSEERLPSSGLFFKTTNSSAPSSLSLSVSVCLNGSKKSLTKLFVNSSFQEFKQEITTQLNKLIPKDQVEFDSKKIRIYNLYGGQIKSSYEILNNEPIFIAASIHEPWVEPQLPTLTQDEIEIANQQLQNERESIIELNSKEILEPISPKKQKRKNDIIQLKQDIENNLKMKEYLKSNSNIKVDDSQNEANTTTMTDFEICSQYYYFTNLLVGINDSDSDSDGNDNSNDNDCDSGSGCDIKENKEEEEKDGEEEYEDLEEEGRNNVKKVEEYLETLRVINHLLDEDDYCQDENIHNLDDDQMEYSEDTECELTFQIWRDYKSKFHHTPRW